MYAVEILRYTFYAEKSILKCDIPFQIRIWEVSGYMRLL